MGLDDGVAVDGCSDGLEAADTTRRISALPMIQISDREEHVRSPEICNLPWYILSPTRDRHNALPNQTFVVRTPLGAPGISSALARHLYCSPAGKQLPLGISTVQLTGLTGLEGTFGQWCVSAGRGGSSDKAAMHRRRHAASVCVTWIRGRECIPVSRLEWELGYLSEVMPPFG